MPQLNWNETDFLECLEVEPDISDYAVSHSYEVNKNGLRLLITVWQYESAVQLTLSRDATEANLFSFAAYVRGEVRYVNDKRGTYLEITDSIVAPSRFSYMEFGDVFDRERFPYGVTVEIGVKPDIRVAIVPFRSTT